MKKILTCTYLLIILFFIIAVIVGKNSVRHVNYQQYASNVKYFSTPIESVYKEFRQIKGTFIEDEEISDIKDLIEKSEYVLKVSVEDEPIFYGSGIINKVNVLEIIKGNNDENIKVGKQLKVYDLVSFWTGDYVNYYGGMTPLNYKNTYVIFIKKAEKANQRDTYIFSSIRYGYFNISVEESNILIDYIQGSLTIDKIIDYDYVETNCESSGYDICDKYVDDYLIMKKQLLDYIDVSN